MSAATSEENGQPRQSHPGRPTEPAPTDADALPWPPFSDHGEARRSKQMNEQQADKATAPGGRTQTDADRLREMAELVDRAIDTDGEARADLLRQVLEMDPEPVLRRWSYNF